MFLRVNHSLCVSFLISKMGAFLVLYRFVMMVSGVDICQVFNTHFTINLLELLQSSLSLLLLLLSGSCSGLEMYSEDNIH